MDEWGAGAALDPWLAPAVRRDLEERLWRPIGDQATMERLLDDPAFFADPGHHPAMFADHGVVHARDVALGVIRFVDVADGVVLPGRPGARRSFLTQLGVVTAYLHDIGMVDMSPQGRRLHAVVAQQAAFGPEVDALIAHLLAEGPIRERLELVESVAPFDVPRETVIRELVALSVIHSKSVIPASLLEDRVALRGLLQRLAFTSLDELRATHPLPSAEDAAPLAVSADAAPHPDPARAWSWLVAGTGAHAELADDAVDAMRVLRVADVLRQRGTVLRTSGGFEICMDAETAHAVCTLRPASGDAAYVLTYDDPRGAGEANIREARVTPRGHLRIAFHRGRFGTPEATRRAVASTANVVLDIESDVLPSFRAMTAGGGTTPPAHPPGSMRLRLERPADRPSFADEVAAEVVALRPSLAPLIELGADTQSADAHERDRFFASIPLETDGPEVDELLRRMGERGADVSGLDRTEALLEVGRVTVGPGEVLVRRGSAPAFVYVPMGEGLVVRPVGGYAPAPLPAWVPVGTTGVIRRAERNSDITAERDVEVVVIPGERYARTWLRPLRPEGLAARVAPRTPA
ncbi:MAG TPA: hypothetical protein VFL03_03375 [Candidatus Limnocylindrales bacterium]|nr:hypothetical protein [Candidatus Limnocylindrales bacterium]